MDEELRRLLHEVEHGDLRPQFNRRAVVDHLPRDAAQLAAVEQALADRLFRLSRPIADASRGPAPDMRVGDAGPFFYLIEALRRAGYARRDELLWIVLDRFAELTEQSYDELYLWCIVELSRSDPKAPGVLWPQVLTLDLQYRGAPWQRPRDCRLVDAPYRLTDLVFYYYILYTPPKYDTDWGGGQPRRRLAKRWPSLGICLQGLAPHLSARQCDLARRALEELSTGADARPVFGDALGLLGEKNLKRRAARQAAREGQQG